MQMHYFISIAYEVVHYFFLQKTQNDLDKQLWSWILFSSPRSFEPTYVSFLFSQQELWARSWRAFPMSIELLRIHCW